MSRYVALRGHDGRWSVARIGKPYRTVAEGLTEDAARAKAKELTR